MKSIKLSIVAAILATTSVVTSVSASEVEVSANMGLTNHYVWRGMSQSDNLPAVQGGIDLGYKGAYVGVWASNVDFDDNTNSTEFDFYVGYAGEVDKFSYDVNFVQYTYPGTSETANFSEAALTLGYDFDVLSASAKYVYGVNAEAANTDSFGNAWELGVSIPLPADITLDASYGDYDNKDTVTGGNVNAFGSYYLVSASKSVGKFDVSLAYTGMKYDVDTNGRDGDGKDDFFVVSVGTSF